MDSSSGVTDNDLQDLLERCMDRDDARRPTFAALVEELRELAAMAVVGEDLNVERAPSRSASLNHGDRRSSLASPGPSLVRVAEEGPVHLADLNVRNALCNMDAATSFEKSH